MKTKHENAVLVGAAVGTGILLIEAFYIFVLIYKPFGSSGSTLVPFFYDSLLFVVRILIIAYGYVRLRRLVSDAKAQWLVVLIATAVQATVAVFNTFMLPHIAFTKPEDETFTVLFNPATSLVSLVVSFLITLGIIHLIARLYKRQSSFEVE